MIESQKRNCDAVPDSQEWQKSIWWWWWRTVMRIVRWLWCVQSEWQNGSGSDMMLRYSSVCSAVATRRFFVGICFSFATVMQDFKIIDEYYPGIVGFFFSNYLHHKNQHLESLYQECGSTLNHSWLFQVCGPHCWIPDAVTLELIPVCGRNVM